MKSIPQDVSESTRRRNPHLYPNALTQSAEVYHVLSRAVETAPPKRIRQSTKPLMNKLEQEYHGILSKSYAVCCHVTVQAMRFKLANGLWYKPDFLVFSRPTWDSPGRNCIFAIEVKGPHAFRGGFENLKMAAHQYLFVTWSLVWKENGEWKKQEVLP